MIAIPVDVEMRGREGSVRVWLRQFSGRAELSFDRALRAAQQVDDVPSALYELALSTVAGAIERVEAPEGWPACPDGSGARADWLDAIGASLVYVLLGELRPRTEDRDLGKSRNGAP